MVGNRNLGHCWCLTSWSEVGYHSPKSLVVMYPNCVFSIRYLLAVTILLPGVLLDLYFDNAVDYVVSECERKILENERRYSGGDDESLNWASSWSQNGQGTEKIQRIFECIGNKIQGPFLEKSPKYKNLKLQCELNQESGACDSFYPYRRIDGKCNNLRSPNWGSGNSCVKHFLQPYYEGISDIRRSVCGTPLPEPRILSLTLFERKDDLSENLSNIFTFFSQLIAHDVLDTPKSNIGGDCCSRPFRQHPQCASIPLPRRDPYFSRFRATCMNFVRAEPCRTCSVGKRNTINKQTSFLDASFLYGLTDRDARKLRRNDGTGKMIVQQREVGDLLPPDFEGGSRCGIPERQEYCFKAGDERANQQTPLASFQIIFMREHNRIAGLLKQLNPQWGEEKLYQESRKIVIAELQVITYKEFLPLLLGSEPMQSHNLALSNSWSFYNPLVDPTVYSEFINGAYRLHTLIPSVVTEFGVDGGKRNLTEFIVHSAEPIYRGDMDALLKGMCLTRSGVMNTFISSEANHVPLGGKLPGTDLISVDIQRGRDTGMPPYTEIIRYLSKGETNIRTFSDLAKIFDPKDVKLLQTLYCDPRDIDYFVGMHFEPQSKDGIMWYSAAEIIAKQFSNLKFGDRFYFEHVGNFNKNQLRALKEVTLSTLVCENTNVPSIQEHALQIPSARNPMKPCGAIPKLNLQFWKPSKL